MSELLITGSTGFIGKQVLKQLAQGEERLLLLVRSPEKAAATLSKQGFGSSDVAERIHFLKGDLSEPNLGMNPADYNRALQADVIIHSGGPMSITLDNAKAQRTFLEGSRHLAELAERVHKARGLRHFIHVVGYMSPIHDGNVDPDADVFRMDDFMKGEVPYERMKFLADLLIRQQALRHGYPLSVVNPSTVVGASPTGATEQTGGLGILVHAVRKGLMPVVPGGASHWVPIVANDALAGVIVHLAREAKPEGGTYNMLGRKEAGPNMKELLDLIAQELAVPAPRGALPVSLLRGVMKTGLGRLTGIPAESLAFITERSFDTKTTEKLIGRMGAKPLAVTELLPMVVADLDYRLTHPGASEPAHWSRERKGDLAALVREGLGEPWVIVHGLLSGADDFVPLAEHLHASTGNPVWLLDLPGFGRSPLLREGRHSLESYAKAVSEAIADSPVPVRLVGHSFGARIALETANGPAGGKLSTLALLQPVLHRPDVGALRSALSGTRRTASAALRLMSVRAMRNTMLREGVFAAEEEIPDGYVETIVRSLTSPRIAAANADMLHSLYRKLPAKPAMPVLPTSLHTTVIWGTKDLAYTLPEAYRNQAGTQLVSYSHQFPVSHPAATAKLLAKQV
ncbi:nonribosomal peptide synthetase MxaA [Paenibacillus elgii]|uniref:Nonribosomal peptide synthetase MxaA n=1 Tax=Paenibacillus elgii TaxID=189691 RepID=A0A2T6GAJ8_9BACL|nr:alpha/beta fold hydrolase [Paenibacillus elgii]PUA41162.1 nonribosomal peptide synthetase MxaA [Paenibacillus elgii]